MSKGNENHCGEAEKLEDDRQMGDEGPHVGTERPSESERNSNDDHSSNDAAHSTGDDYVVPAASPDDTE